MYTVGYLSYSVREGCKSHVLSWNSIAAISLFKIRRVTHIKKPVVFKRKKMKKKYNFPIPYLVHVIHWYHKCIYGKMGESLAPEIPVSDRKGL